MWSNLLILTGCIPSLVLLVALMAGRLGRKKAGERSPQKEKLLRPAGYSLSVKIADLGDNFSGWMMGALLASLASVGLISIGQANNTATKVIIFVIFGFTSVACTVMAFRTANSIRLYRLGLLGEQSVAEHLQGLLRSSYCVFHDIGGDGKWNIDHVVVGPSGVFAIETKSKTKRPGKKGENDYEATFDGNAIHFPWGYDTDAPEQARRNAKWLAIMLSKATGENVTVQPIVALPGWFVQPHAEFDVKVLSGKQVPNSISKGPKIISDKLIRQVSYQLELRCRTVEF